jgi:hypothetical protein
MKGSLSEAGASACSERRERELEQEGSGGDAGKKEASARVAGVVYIEEAGAARPSHRSVQLRGSVGMAAVQGRRKEESGRWASVRLDGLLWLLFFFSLFFF